MAYPEGFDPENPSCPKCGGRMFDNRENKKSPKSPDFKCKDSDCGQPLWGTPYKGGAKSAPKAATPKQGELPMGSPTHRLTVDEWLTINDQVLATVTTSMVQALKAHSLTPMKENVGSLLTEARSLTASFWIAVGQKVVTTAPERPAPKEAEAKPAKPTEHAAPPGILLGNAAEGYRHLIGICDGLGSLESTRDMFMQDDNVPLEERAVLLQAVLSRRRELS